MMMFVDALGRLSHIVHFCQFRILSSCRGDEQNNLGNESIRRIKFLKKFKKKKKQSKGVGCTCVFFYIYIYKLDV